MVMFEVWAPGRQRVEARAGRSPPAGHGRGRRQAGGTWTSPLPRETGTSSPWTAGPPAPTLGRRWQPDGVDGPSVVVDQASFPWTDQDWPGASLSGAVIYELHVGTFSPEGTFDGAAARLGHLVGLGVNAVELLPVAEASGSRGWGYDGADLWAPHHAYGGPAGLKRLVDACHARGIAVVLDVVYNHLGRPAITSASSGLISPTPIGRRGAPPSTWTAKIVIGVRDFVISNALMWLRDYHIDGLRLDAVHAIYDESASAHPRGTGAAVDGLGRPDWAASCGLSPRATAMTPGVARSARRAMGTASAPAGTTTSTTPCTPSSPGRRAVITSISARVAQLAKVFDGRIRVRRPVFRVPPAPPGPAGRRTCPGLASCAACKTTTRSVTGPWGSASPPWSAPDLLKVGAALVLLSPFVPMLFQGEEWGASTPFLYFTDHQDPELGAAVREGRRREHPMEGGAEVPDPQGLETFLRSKLDWSRARSREPHRSLLDWYRRSSAPRQPA